MKPVLVPTSDVNSENGVLIAWRMNDGDRVEKDQAIAEVETSKAILEVLAPAAGWLQQLAAAGAEIVLAEPIARLFDSEAELQASKAARARVAGEPSGEDGVKATVKARQRAAELGVDLSTLAAGRLITVKEVEAAAAARPFDLSALPAPLAGDGGQQRVLLIGGARGATQVIDIFRGGDTQKAVAIVDDSREKWGEEVYGVPIVGGSERIAELFAAGAFDAAIVAISTSIAARRKFRELLSSLGVPMANAIDRTSKIASEVVMGTGNVICAFCHFGTSAVVGDNNFFSAYNSFEHHNVLGSDISTGPGCVTSSRVKLGDGVRLGTGIFIQPGVELGEGVQVASGAILVKSVPAWHAVKTKVVTTTVVPLRR